ncbi:MAG: hypothetical protein ACE5FJ_00570 [Gemmatimonadales bacterium]
MRSDSCSICGHGLDPVRHPVRRLSWTRHWGKGFASLFTRPLKGCSNCGSLFDWDGELLARGALPTTDELKLQNLRSDMSNLRDSFMTIFAAAGFATTWMILNPSSFDAASPMITGGIGLVSLLPYSYFRGKANQFKREIKQLRKNRIGNRESGVANR